MAETAPTLGELETGAEPQAPSNESAADTMRKVMSEFGMAQAEAEADPEPASADKTADVSRETAAVRNRDERTGKFIPKDNAVQAEPSDAPKPNGKAAPATAEPEAEPADDYIEPPPEWAVEAQEDFRKLPAPARKIVLDHSQAAQQAIGQANALAQRFSSVEQILAPRREAFARDGLDDAGYLRQLFAISDFATRDKAGFLRWYMQANQIAPETVFGQPRASTEEQGYVDPEIAELRQGNAQMAQRLAQIERMTEAQVRGAQQSQFQEIVGEVDQFRAARDPQGKVAHPYFDQVRSLMQGLFKSEVATDLQTAYDMACHAHPEVRAKIAAATRAADEQERARQNRAKAATAGKAGSSIAGTPADRTPEPPSDDIRADMRRQFAERGLM